MRYLHSGAALASRELDDGPRVSEGAGESRLSALREQIAATPPANVGERLTLGLAIVGLELDMGREADAGAHARALFDDAMAAQSWEGAARAARMVYLAGHPDAIAALGHAIWLAVTYPVDPELSVAVLQHLVDETPADADGAAVAAATAHLVADLRACGAGAEELRLFAGRLLASVARRHSAIQEQSAFDDWVRRLELDDPDKVLVRLRNVIDVMVQDQWWIDRDALRARLPA